jgi:hypothetical protein
MAEGRFNVPVYFADFETDVGPVRWGVSERGGKGAEISLDSPIVLTGGGGKGAMLAKQVE